MGLFNKLFGSSDEDDNKKKISSAKNDNIDDSEEDDDDDDKDDDEKGNDDESNKLEEINLSEEQKNVLEGQKRIDKVIQESIEKGYTENQIKQAVFDESKKWQEENALKEIKKSKNSGLLQSIHGITVEDWAAANVKRINGANIEDVIKILGVEKPIWDEANVEWTDRLSKSEGVRKIYSDAFTNPNIGKFAGIQDVKGKNSSTEATQAVQQVMDSLDLYVKIACHMGADFSQGISSEASLKKYQLSVGDWSNIGVYWGNKLSSDPSIFSKYSMLMDKYQKEFTAPQLGDDISF